MFKNSIFCTLALVISIGLTAFGETRNIVPRADGEGGLGTTAKRWGNFHSKTSTTEVIILDGVNITNYFGSGGGGGGGTSGGISNVIVNGKAGVLTGSGSNVVSTVTLVPSDIGAASTASLASGLSAGSNYAQTVADAASNGAVAVARGFSVTNVTLSPGLNITLNGGGAPVILTPNSTITIASSGGGGGGGGGISNVVVNGKTGVLSGSGSNIVSTVTLSPSDIGAASQSEVSLNTTFRTDSTVYFSTNSGNAATVGGLTAEDIMRVGSQYFFSTNQISYGVVTGRSASLTAPIATQIASYTDPTNGQYLGTYLISSNEMPSVLLRGVYTFKFFGYHSGNGKHPLVGADVYIISASNGVVVHEFENAVGSEVKYSADSIPQEFLIQVNVTNDYPKDGYAFVLKTKLIDDDGYHGTYYSYMGVGYWAGFIIPIVSGLYVTKAEVGTAAYQPTSAFDPAGTAGAVQANLTTHTNRTDNPHAVTAAQVGALSTNGGTVTGSILTTVTATPQDDELPTAGWVRGLLMSGAEWYYTTNQATGYGAKSANFVELSRDLPAIASSNVIASPVPSGTYLAGGVMTGTLQRLTSPITIDMWAQRIGGTAASIIPLYAEVYYIYDGTTNHLGDWSVGPWNLTDSVPQNHRFVVSFNEPTITGAVNVIAYIKTGTVSGPAAGMRIYSGGGYSSHLDIEGTSGATAEQVDGRLTTHTNLTLASGAHPDGPALASAVAGLTAHAAAQTNVNAGVASELSGLSNRTSALEGLTNRINNTVTNGGSGASLTGITAAQVGAVPTSRTITIDGVTYDLSSDRTWTTAAGGISAATATNIAQVVVDASHAPIYWLTNTIVVSNSLNYSIPLMGNNIRVRWMVMFLSATNESATSKGATFAMFNRPDYLCDGNIYLEPTNQLYWASPSTSAQAAGATTGTVADASGVLQWSRYAVGNGTRWDFLTATQATATVISWGCTNKYATTASANTKISKANYLTPIFYDDDSGTSNMWCRLVWNTPYTGTVTTIMRYSK